MIDFYNFGWGKAMTKKLTDAGLTWDQARMVVGEMAEQRQIADREGYSRGYNDGYGDALSRHRSMGIF